MAATPIPHGVNELCHFRFGTAEATLKELKESSAAMETKLAAMEVSFASFKNFVMGATIAICTITPVLTTLAVKYWH